MHIYDRAQEFFEACLRTDPQNLEVRRILSLIDVVKSLKFEPKRHDIMGRIPDNVIPFRLAPQLRH